MWRLLFFIVVLSACSGIEQKNVNSDSRLAVIFDTDANNEVDDQHALAYLLLSDSVFNVKGVTVNSTYNGGGVEQHYKEAERVVKLCNKHDQVQLYMGAQSDFEQIKHSIDSSVFDGYQAVNFIISEAKKQDHEKLILLAVGKLTNAALAVKKDTSIIPKLRIVWLGSNYPEKGEYNLENDVEAMNYLLQTQIEFEMAVCRYGEPSGTDAVRVTQSDVIENMSGVGPKILEAVEGRHGQKFSNFGDYSVNLFSHIEYYGNPPSRALFDMAAVAIVKNPNWAIKKSISAPSMVNGFWIDHPGNKRKIIVWESFNADAILNDFYSVFK